MKKYLDLVKFSHSIFALPFALVGFFIAIARFPLLFEWKLLLFVLLCMVFARNAAMAFNRLLDRDIDARNPRTSEREIPSGKVSVRSALFFVVVNSFLFVITTYFINLLCFTLAPFALLVILGYSYTKRFTWFCHFLLGLGLGIAPVGAYLAVTGTMEWNLVFLSVAVLCWTAGFDIIYALQDVDFDKKNDLHSVPVKWGVYKAFNVSVWAHILSAICFILFAIWVFYNLQSIGYLFGLANLTFLSLLAYQHKIVSPNDLSRVNIAFFTMNGVASLAYGFLTILDLYI